MAEGEVGYGLVTEGITGGYSVKIQTTGGHIELEANHRLVMCNYPFYLFIYKSIVLLSIVANNILLPSIPNNIREGRVLTT